jgi:hypothetical protein
MFNNEHPKHLIAVGVKRMSDRAVVSFTDGINVKMSVRLLVQQCTAARLRLPSDETLEIGQGMVVFVCFNKVIRHPFVSVLWIRIRMFLSLSDPHPGPLVTSKDPAPRILPSSTKNSKKTLIFTFCDIFKTFCQCSGSV